MMTPLARHARPLWLFISAISYVATFCGVGDRLDAAEVSTDELSVRAAPYRPEDPPVETVVRRDPFLGSVRSDRGRIANEPALDDVRHEASDAEVTVPDIEPSYAAEITFGETARSEAPALSVRATIAGSRPVAYVEVGDDLDIVRVSDTVGGRRVASIDLRGLAFTDGTRLDLSETFAPTPAPRRGHVSNRTVSLTREFARLRELLLSRTMVPAAPPPAASAPSPDSVVTPAPLRTVDPSGRSVGTTPSPDIGAPTAFPVPYPYPPRPR